MSKSGHYASVLYIILILNKTIDSKKLYKSRAVPILSTNFFEKIGG